jgi:hypothetical protein
MGEQEEAEMETSVIRECSLSELDQILKELYDTWQQIDKQAGIKPLVL